MGTAWAGYISVHAGLGMVITRPRHRGSCPKEVPMSTLPRWIASLALAAGFGAAALAPAPAKASDELVRIIVDVADVVLRGNQPYYRHGGYGRHDRLIVVH